MFFILGLGSTDVSCVCAYVCVSVGVYLGHVLLFPFATIKVHRFSLGLDSSCGFAFALEVGVEQAAEVGILAREQHVGRRVERAISDLQNNGLLAHVGLEQLIDLGLALSDRILA